MGVYIKIPSVEFKNYIGIAEIEEEPITPDCTHEYDNACDTSCNLCGATRTVTHNYVDGVCTICGAKDPYHINSYPVKDSTLKGLYDLSGEQTAAVIDHAGNGNDATVEGEGVTFADGYVHFTGKPSENHISTPFVIAPENGATLVAMFRVPEGKRSLLSNYKYMKGGINFANGQVYNNASSAGGSKYFTAGGTVGFAICAIYVGADGYRVTKYSDGSVLEALNYAGNVDMNTVNVWIGGSLTNSLADDADIAFVSIHEGNVTDEQLQQIFEYLKKYGESNGLTIE